MARLLKIFVIAVMLILPGLVSACGSSPQAEKSIIITVSRDDPQSLIVHGIPGDAGDFIGRGGTLAVFVASAPAGAPAIGGELHQRGNDLVFIPRYPFQPGLEYRADLVLPAEQPSAAAITRSSNFKIPAPPATPVVKIDAIYPSAEELPENLLRFYIQFSGPMSRGEAYQHIHLLDDGGHAVPSPFLELGQELWNPEMTRFTLFFDPGRIKQGLVPRMEMGLALERGRSYTLMVDGDWQDGEHRQLVAAGRKEFRVIPADARQPDPGRWRVTPPAANTTQPLIIQFDKPLDHAMLQRVISVTDPAGRTLSGKISISDHEQAWSFSPESPWRAGKYAVVVQTILEDTAGNSIGRPFEVDLTRPSAATAPATIELVFGVR